VHFLQIWIMPERRGIAPGYEQKSFSPEEKRGRLRLVGSRDGREGSVTIHRDVDLYAALIGKDDAVDHTIGDGRLAWVQVARGSVTVNGEHVRAGDGVAVPNGGRLRIAGTLEDAEILLFDMAP
jgi:redox-sensitive bicupin YhaK (pirin superfamily)